MELLKYKAQKFTINYTKQIEKQQQRIKLENKLKILEKNLDEGDNLSKYNSMNQMIKMNQMQFTTTSQKAQILEANVTGMNKAKNQKKVF